MRRLVAALVLAGTVSMSVMAPSASAQGFGGFPYGGFGFGPQLESYGFSGNTPFYSTNFSGPFGVQCQYGAYLGNSGSSAGSLASLSSINTSNLTPFFTASASGPVFGPGPCTPPQFARPFFNNHHHGFLGGINPIVLNGTGGLGSLVGTSGVTTTTSGLNCTAVSNNVAVCR